MRKLLIITAAAAALAGCQTTQERTLGGALIGGTGGAIIGGAATGTAGGAVAGGLLGGVAGAMVGNATAEPCYVRTRSGHLRRVRC